MDATLMFSAHTTPAPVSAAPSSAAASGASQAHGVETSADPGSAANGRIFAGLMRGLLPTHERQDVAAGAEAATGDTAETGELKTEVLGDQLNVITTNTTLTDPDSLTAFARAQGLDEAAVKALFGEMAALDKAKIDAAQTLPNLTVITDPSAAPVNVAWLASQLSAEITLHVSAVKSPSLSATPATDAGEGSAPLGAEMGQGPGMGWGMVANTLAWMVPAAAPGGASAAFGELQTLSVKPLTSGTGPLGLNATINPLSVLPATPPPASALVAPASLLGGVLPAAAQPAASTDTPAEAAAATEALDLLAPTTPSPQDAMRIRLVPAWSMVTQQLTQMSGTAMTSTWGALTATTLGAPTRSVALDLTTPLASESDDAASLNGTEGGWTSSTDVNRASPASTPLPGATPIPGMAQTLRQEHYAQLANRLGQAMAERLQSQIERGEWKLQMRLNPANLGRIDVELDMHSKGLDAMFRSENPLTRELMAQSMPKLKDTLAQSGMAVASVWVNSDAGRQSDGNPTPQRDRTDVSDTPTTVQTDVGAVPATKAKRTPDGFDVLA